MTQTITSPTALRDILDDTLAEAVLALATTEGAEAPPERRYVGHGRVTATPGCPELSVLVGIVTPKLLDVRSNQCAVILQANLSVTLLRCIPVMDSQGTAPSADVESAANLQLAIDGWALQKHFTRAWADGSWPEGVNCRRVTWLTCEALPDDGGLAGWRITFRVDMA